MGFGSPLKKVRRAGFYQALGPARSVFDGVSAICMRYIGQIIPCQGSNRIFSIGFIRCFYSPGSYLALDLSRIVFTEGAGGKTRDRVLKASKGILGLTRHTFTQINF